MMPPGNQGGSNVPQRRSEVARLSESENICLDDFTLLTVVVKGRLAKSYRSGKMTAARYFA